jgi:lysophospholipase L1-like esterase
MNFMGFVAPLIRPVLRRTMAMRISQFEQLPSQSGRIVFLGDSITEAGIWDEWFPDLPVLNRGVGGDSVGGVHARLATAIADPLAVSLLIGTNDLSGLGHSRDIGRIADQTRALVGDIQDRAPKATLLLNSVMPRRRSMATAIRDLNDRYAKIAAEAGATYVDLWPVLADSDGAIRRNFTRDHLHLNGVGYEAWVGELRPLLAPFA